MEMYNPGLNILELGKVLHAFVFKQHFYKQHQAEISKKLWKAKQHPHTELLIKMSK